MNNQITTEQVQNLIGLGVFILALVAGRLGCMEWWRWSRTNHPEEEHTQEERDDRRIALRARRREPR
jgi:hypothetical protein